MFNFAGPGNAIDLRQRTIIAHFIFTTSPLAGNIHGGIKGSADLNLYSTLFNITYFMLVKHQGGQDRAGCNSYMFAVSVEVKAEHRASLYSL